MTLFVLTWTEETTRGGNDRGGKEFMIRSRDYDEENSSFSGKDVLSSFTSSSSDSGFKGGFGGKRRARRRRRRRRKRTNKAA